MIVVLVFAAGAGHDDLIVRDDRSRLTIAGDVGRPSNVLIRGPGCRQGLFAGGQAAVLKSRPLGSFRQNGCRKQANHEHKENFHRDGCPAE